MNRGGAIKRERLIVRASRDLNPRPRSLEHDPPCFLRVPGSVIKRNRRVGNLDSIEGELSGPLIKVPKRLAAQLFQS